MNAREGIVLMAVMTLLGAEFRSNVVAQEPRPAPRGDNSPASKIPQPNPIFPRPPQSDPGLPNPNGPQRNPAFPQENPSPRAGRSASEMEEKMVVTPNDIRTAQEALRAKGLQPGNDGKLDEQTQEALAKFQKQNNLPPTGVLDEKTAAKLGVDSKREKN
jgi:putative peptidoglycan binding protein